MSDSILESVKSYLGISKDDNAFNSDILMAINATMVVLNQLGVGPDNPVTVDSDDAKWNIIDEKIVGIVREYVSMRVRMLFDPPTTTYIKQALDDQISEFEWRILAEIDKKDYETREVEV